MAELEACTALVDEALKGEEPKTPTTPTAPGHLEGESQLLPLLQGLLEAPENDITPDSGTESGEDQRTSLIAEVQTALEKLSNSLKSDQTDITAERRSSLLQLVTKLQAGLSGGSSAPERRASTVSSSGRFQRRKNKQARHTVGVSKEELADARRLIEQISLSELTPSNSANKLQLSKQNSESSVPTSSASSSYRNVPQKVKNTAPKPFSSSNSTTSSVQTPTEHLEGFEGLYDEKEAPSQEAVHQKSPSRVSTVKPSLERNASVDSNVSIKSACIAVQKAAANKVAALKRSLSREQTELSGSEEEEEEETSTVKGASDLENAPLKSNPIYSKPSLNEERSSRFDTQKKLKMKRANTIDIPKPLLFYEDEEDSDSEHDDDGLRKRDNCQPLRAPLNVGNPHTKKIVPAFTPKTDSDKKFLAFINKHNENEANKGSMWAKNTANWGNRFGHIKSTFEQSTPATQDARGFWKSADDNVKKSTQNQFGPRISRRSARNLQQMFEEKQKEIQKTAPPHRQINVASTPQHQGVVTGSLQVKTQPDKQYRVVPQPLPVNQFSHAPQSAFKPIKKTAPQSPASKRTSLVFSPEGNEILKSEIKSNEGSSFLYSPKPLSSSVESSTVTSPVVGSKPWTATSGGRVLSMAAAKFEQPPCQEQPKPRRLSKDSSPRSFLSHGSPNVVDRAPAYLNKGIVEAQKAGTVRKLSGNYDNQEPQTYQVKTNVVESQYSQPKHYQPTVKGPAQQPSMPAPQNYSIRYDQPQNYAIRYDQKINPAAQQPQNYSTRNGPQNQSLPQNYSIRYDQPQTNQQYTPQNYSIRYDQPLNRNYTIKYDQPRPQQQPISQSNVVYQHVPGKEPTVAPQQLNRKPLPDQEKEYTSSCEFRVSPKVPVQPIEPVRQPSKVQRQISDESLHEYNAVNSRVMTGPVGQQAVTVKQGPMSRDQHDIAAAFGLKNSLQKVAKQEANANTQKSPNRSPARSPSHSFSYKPRDAPARSPGVTQSFKYKGDPENFEVVKYKPSDCPKPTVAPSSFKAKSIFEDVSRKEARNCGVVKPMQQQKPIYNNTSSVQTRSTAKLNEKNLTVVTGQFHIPIPAINVKSPESPRMPSHSQVLSKSDSWHEICLAHQNIDQKPAPKPGPVKSKSSNTLSVPKMYEAGMSKEEMLNKRRTMEAFLAGTKPAEAGGKTVKRSINRVRTSQKISTQSKSSGGIVRSRTLPDIACPDMLDENNIDKAFDELFQSS